MNTGGNTSSSNETSPATTETTTSATNSTTATPVENTTPVVAEPQVIEENHPELTCFSCVYSGFSFDERGCWAPYSNNTRTQGLSVATTMDACVAAGQTVMGSTEQIEIGDLRNATLQLSRECNAAGQEFLLVLTNPLMDVNQLNVSLSSDSTNSSMPSGYIGVSCSAKTQCGLSALDGTGLVGYETSYNEKISVWMLCQGDASSNITLSVDGAYLRDYVVEEEWHSALNKGGIAGIVVAAAVVVIFAIGLIISTKGLVWFKNLCRCCQKN